MSYSKLNEPTTRSWPPEIHYWPERVRSQLARHVPVAIARFFSIAWRIFWQTMVVLVLVDFFFIPSATQIAAGIAKLVFGRDAAQYVSDAGMGIATLGGMALVLVLMFVFVPCLIVRLLVGIIPYLVSILSKNPAEGGAEPCNNAEGAEGTW